MRLSGKTGGAWLCVLAAVAMLTSSASRAAAQAPLRWKFEKGDKLDYNMVQDMTMAAEGGPLGQMNSEMRQEMDMTWDVQEVNDQGEAEIRQKFDRVQMKMTLPPPLGGFDFDSDSDAAPTGLAAMIAPMYKAMTEGEFLITMTARGEVKDVKVPDEVLAALKNSPGAAAMGDMATPEGFKKMISQGALVLPENAPKEGEVWSTKLEVNNPAAGKQTVETTYRFAGIKEIDGTTFAVIRPQLTMDFAGNPQPNVQMKISEQKSEGEVLFNVEEGRLHSSSIKQNVTIDVTAAGQAMKQKIEQKIDVKVSPAGEEESETKSAESEQKEAVLQ